MTRFLNINKTWRFPSLVGFLLLAATLGATSVMADETNLVSQPAGFLRLTVPANS